MLKYGEYLIWNFKICGIFNMKCQIILNDIGKLYPFNRPCFTKYLYILLYSWLAGNFYLAALNP